MRVSFASSFILALSCILSLSGTIRVHMYQEDMPVTIFSHGFGADYAQANFYKTLFCSKNYIAFNYPDAPEKLFEKNTKTGLAQKSEMKALECALETAIDLEKPVVIYGVSRGASVIINVIGMRTFQKKPLPEIRAIVLESPFAHCEDVINGYASQFKLPAPFMRFLFKRFLKEYNSKKNAPIDWVHHMPKSIPILFISTKEDTIVPAASTQRLYQALCKDGHEHAYALVFDNGLHANLVWSIHGRDYATTLHAFYEVCGLPYDKEIAFLGVQRLNGCKAA